MRIMNERLIIDAVNTELGIKLIYNWFKLNYDEDIKVYRSGVILFKSRQYKLVNGNNFRKSDLFLTVVAIYPNEISVDPIYKWKIVDIYSKYKFDYRSDYRNNFDINGLNNKIGSNYESSGYDKSESRMPFDINKKRDILYVKGENISNDLCLYIQSIHSIIRDMKIDDILS